MPHDIVHNRVGNSVKEVAEEMELEKKTATRKTAAPRKKTVSSTAKVAIPKKSTAGRSAKSRNSITPEERRRLIEASAYLKAERRGFQGASPVNDWLEAEAEIDAMLIRPGGRGE
jgi:hypothetical protein